MKCLKAIGLALGTFVLCLTTAVAAESATWERHMQAATAAYREGELPKAERSLLAALRRAEEFGSQDLRLAATLNNLGVLYYAEGKYTKAEPLHRRALAIREQALGPTHPDVAQTLNNLAGVYGAEGRLAEAETLYRRCLSIREMTLGENDPEVAKTLENYAELLRARGRYTEAALMEARAQTIRNKQTQ